MSHHVIVREKTGDREDHYDIYSRLFEDRIICLNQEINDHTASLTVLQLLYLSKKSEQDITLYILSPGGSVVCGLSIYDTMQLIPNKIKTVALGSACSMGAFLLSAGTKGMRYATPSSRIMIHMVSGGAHGTTKDVKIQLAEQQYLNELLNERLAKHCGKTITQIEKATERDNYMSPEEAKKFGLIDDVLIPTHTNFWK